MHLQGAFMPDDHNVPVGGAGQPHSARVNFASDSVRKKVEDLLAESGGSLASVDGQERRRIAARLRKARAAAPLNLLPLLTLLLAACGKTTPNLTGANEAGPGPDNDTAHGEDDSADEAPSLPDAGWRFVKASAAAGRPPMSPEAEANMVRLCLQAITDNTLQPSAIHEICSLIDLDDVDRSHDVIWRWTAPPRTEGYSTNEVCYLVNAQDLLFWMFMESPAAATGYAGRLRPKSVPEIPGDAQGDGITDASLVSMVRPFGLPSTPLHLHQFSLLRQQSMTAPAMRPVIRLKVMTGLVLRLSIISRSIMTTAATLRWRMSSGTSAGQTGTRLTCQMSISPTAPRSITRPATC